MRYNLGSVAWIRRDKWRHIVEDLRTGDLSRRKAYALSHQFRVDNPGSCMGPAYYTKLIFFAAPPAGNGYSGSSGYIMDQWTSLSIYLLFGTDSGPLIDLSSSEYRGRRTDTVTDRNTPEIYEIFCQKIEFLADRLGISPEAVEERLFSVGGQRPGAWRKYVKENRPPRRRKH